MELLDPKPELLGLYFVVSNLPYHTIHYGIQVIQYHTKSYSTVLCSALLYSTLLYSALLYSTSNNYSMTDHNMDTLSMRHRRLDLLRGELRADHASP